MEIGMRLYQLAIPTKIYFGRDIWKEALNAQEMIVQGNVMIVTTGRSLIRLGYLEQLEIQIKENFNVNKVIIFDTVSANPRLSEVKDGIVVGRQEKIDVIVGFGGGSSLDAAKAIAAGIPEKVNIEALFYQGKEPGKYTLPIIAIPTTAGTGSELSKAAIITDEQQRIKKGIRGTVLYPQAAIVDSIFTESVPFSATMETGFDVLAHGMESYLSKAASPFTKMQSEYAIQIVGKYLPRLSNNLQDIEAREKMSYASMIMGINLGNASTCLPHRLQCPLGAYTDTSHGEGLAALFPAWIDCEYGYVYEDIERMIELLTGECIHGKEACIEKIRKFIQKIQLPVSLSQLGVGEKAFLDIFEKGVTGNIGNDPAVGKNDRNIIRELYQAAWE